MSFSLLELATRDPVRASLLLERAFALNPMPAMAALALRTNVDDFIAAMKVVQAYHEKLFAERKERMH